MVLRIRIEFFPEVTPPELPPKDAKPARSAEFYANADHLKSMGALEMLEHHFLQAVRLALVGEPKDPPKILVPGNEGGPKPS